MQTGAATVASCATGLTLCGDVCVDVTSNVSHCGDCNVACQEGLLCSASTCTSACGTGLTPCVQDCVNLATDALNCGGCGIVCLTGQTCTNGVCTGEATGGDPTVPVQTPAQQTVVEDDGGCGCATTGAGSDRLGALVGLLAGLSALARRRRRQG